MQKRELRSQILQVEIIVQRCTQTLLFGLLHDKERGRGIPDAQTRIVLKKDPLISSLSSRDLSSDNIFQLNDLVPSDKPRSTIGQ